MQRNARIQIVWLHMQFLAQHSPYFQTVADVFGGSGFCHRLMTYFTPVSAVVLPWARCDLERQNVRGVPQPQPKRARIGAAAPQA